MPGRKWLSRFLKRHKEISIRKPEATSFLRAAGFNRPAVKKFFDILTMIYDEKKFDASRIFNCDATGMITVQKSSKILGKRGKHQIGSLISGERGKNVTTVCCMTATGQHLTVAFIFPVSA